MNNVNDETKVNMENAREGLKRIMLVVAYDGTNYHGWQLQPEAITVEKVLNDTLSNLLGEEIAVIGASRTDSGVHALGNIAVFDTVSRIPGEKYPYVLNQLLPEDIRIQKSKEVDLSFHPRKCDTKKTYEYRILNTEFEIPTMRYNYHHCHFPLDEVAMDKASKALLGEHDFTSYCSVNAQSETRVRTITDIGVTRTGNEVIIRVTGNGFLYNMVRIIAGSLMEVGRGHMSIESIEDALKAKSREAAGPTAPAKGLTLIGYEFL